MERNVVTLETAKKLKAAGFPQEIGIEHWWATNIVGNAYLYVMGQKSGEGDDYFSPLTYASFGWDCVAAPTAQEIADQLPVSVPGKRVYGYSQPRYLLVTRSGNGYRARYEAQGYTATGGTMVEALALLWLKLQEVAA